jgi:hypothetical protein
MDRPKSAVVQPKDTPAHCTRQAGVVRYAPVALNTGERLKVARLRRIHEHASTIIVDRQDRRFTLPSAARSDDRHCEEVEPVEIVTLKNRALSPVARSFIDHARGVANPLAKRKK